MKIAIVLITCFITSTSFSFDLSEEARETTNAMASKEFTPANELNFSDEALETTLSLVGDYSEGTYSLTPLAAIEVARLSISGFYNGNIPANIDDMPIVTRWCVSENIFVSTLSSVITRGLLTVGEGICAKKDYEFNVATLKTSSL